MELRVGDLVEVRGREEILATLDERGELENLPFMPEMLRYCGRRLTVHKVAHKLCDTISRSGMRKMERAVHLTGARCDGAAHGGCQTACSLYWKEAWLRKVEPGDPPRPAASSPRLLPLLQVNTRKGADAYSCQATELLRAAPTCLPFRDLGQYVTDVRSGNAGVPAVARAFLVGLFNRFQEASKKILPRRLWIRRGLRWGFVEGRAGRTTPTGKLDLQPGELVRIRPKDDILATLDDDLLNRGLGFEEEMARHCGRTARVRARVERCLDEKTGRMLHMKNPCIILDDLVCEGVYNANCPREFVPFWREIWLERVEDGT
ncbi:hypothetical protein [Nonomuraea harbinensis]|uniref:Uncharacterized protein n=1 Tax=Nonomuraea harbinensis TaxID=1286938 RepID=A0ABW1C4X5_9ACTN|nr:hypothetical protein [Nonomuraea harbinensis]